jgi:hypothetical protein
MDALSQSDLSTVDSAVFTKSFDFNLYSDVVECLTRFLDELNAKWQVGHVAETVMFAEAKY